MSDTVLNIFGVEDNTFIEEVTDIGSVALNRVYFALLVNGLPRDVGFGVGLSELLGEQSIKKLEQDIVSKIQNTLGDYVDDFTVQNAKAIRSGDNNSKINVTISMYNAKTDETIDIPLEI